MKNDPFASGAQTGAAPRCRLSIVVPVFNEQEALPAFHRRLLASLSKVQGGWEVVYVDDASTDATPRVLREMQAIEPAVGIARFSRNFGKEAAMTAGLRLAHGDAVVVIDADLQHPPEAIESMLRAWRDGADVVNMRRKSRAGEAWLKRVSARLFYRTINRVSEVPIPMDVGDFRLLSRRAVDALNRLDERTRFMTGLFAWIGYREVTLDYDHQQRVAGTTKWLSASSGPSR